MAKADLHCHSIFSEHPSEWFLQRLGAGESYTDPDYIYRELKACGMDFVTITDHNRIGGVVQLREKHPQDVFMGVESTVYFPEDGCKVHILVYGFEERLFPEIQRLRTDIYQFRDFLKQERLAHSVAHATYSVNGRLTADHLEKLLLLFDVFEGRNGGRNRLNNEGWIRVLLNLKPEHFEDLRRKHGIEPFGDTPWFKGLTGGSDDHAGLYLGKCRTVAGGVTPMEFLESVRNKRSSHEGVDNDFQSLVFAIYKIGLDYSRSKGKSLSSSLSTQVNEYIMEQRELSWRNRMKLAKLRSDAQRNPDEEFKRAFAELMDALEKNKEADLDSRFNIAYEKLSDIADAFFRMLLKSIEENVKEGNLLKIVRNVSSTLPGIFLMLPFLSSIHHLYKNRQLILDMQQRFGCREQQTNKHILWFTDTIDDLNGVSMTLSNVRAYAGKLNRNVTVVSTGARETQGSLVLPGMYSFRLPHYDNYEINVPSVLAALDRIYHAAPDEIVVSTPGPTGMLGLLAAKMFNVPCTGIYHTDFTAQANAIEGNESLNKLLETAVHWFYQQMDTVRVPTRAYMDMLEPRGIDRTRMRIFRRGIDTTHFKPSKSAKLALQKQLGLPDGVYLLYTGRISRDKNLSLLLEAFHLATAQHPKLTLLLAGEGPHRKDLEKIAGKQVRFLGRVERNVLPDYYAGCDLFVFPSVTDTFGMSVLEAQACGLPALVSNVGGPQELVVDGETGWIVRENTAQAWTTQIVAFVHLLQNNPTVPARMKEAAHRRVSERFGWEAFFNQFSGEDANA